MKIGYTSGIFDLFHVGHVNLLRNAKNYCDKLIVGVATDELSVRLKNKLPIYSLEDRIQILKSIIYVDQVYVKNVDDNFIDWEILRFDIMIKGDDWKLTERGMKLSKDLKSVSVPLIFVEYTNKISSTKIRNLTSKYD